MLEKGFLLLGRSQIKKLNEEKRINIIPYDEKKLKSNWYALHPYNVLIDVETQIDEPNYEAKSLRKEEYYIIEPKDYIEIEVEERIILDNGIVGLFVPSSHIIEEGIMLTAGKLDSNYQGVIKFGAFNAKDRPVNLWKHLPVAYLLIFGSEERVKEDLYLSEYDMFIRELRASKNVGELVNKLVKFQNELKSGS
jgi:deoxycytidine triphosphate deaminase